MKKWLEELWERRPLTRPGNTRSIPVRKPQFRPLEQLEDRVTPATVGYYDMGAGQGVPNQVAPIVTAGHTPVQLTTLTAGELAGIDVLFVQNPSNSNFGGEYLSRLADVQNAVTGGAVLIIHDRFVDLAETILPGGAGFDIRRDFTDDANIDVQDNTTVVTNGPGGIVNNSTLDGGTSSSHGFAVAGSLPASAKLILSTGTPTNIVTFSYGFGGGSVVYSTIPLDFYLGGGNNFKNIYAPNVVAYGAGLSAPATLSADLTGGVLTVADTADRDNDLTISRSGTDLVISDAKERFISAPAGGALSNGDKTLTLPLASVNSFIVNAAGGDDIVTVTGPATGMFPAFTVNGDAGNDTVNLNAGLTFAAGNDLAVTAELINVVAPQSVSGGGTIDLAASKGVTLSGANADLSTGGGLLTIDADSDADGAGTFTTDNAGSSISTGAGAIDITAADVALSGTIAGTSTLAITSSNGSTVVGAGGAGKFGLDDAEIALLADGFSSITIDGGVGGSSTFTENFNAGGLPAGFNVAGPSIQFTGGAVRFPGGSDGQRTYLRTNDADYFGKSFTAEVTVTMGGHIAFFGMGAGTPTGGSNEPGNPTINLRLHPNSLVGGRTDASDNGAAAAFGFAGSGTHRLRLVWDATTKLARFDIDVNYAGGAFVTDLTSGNVNGADNGFADGNTRIFFGGTVNNVFDDLSINSTSPGGVTIDSATFTDPVTFIGKSASVTDPGAAGFGLRGTGNASVTFDTDTGTKLAADVTTEGQPILFDDPVTMAGDATVATTAGGSPGGLITVTGPIDDDAGTSDNFLSFDAGTGGVVLNAAIGATTALDKLTIDATAITAGNIATATLLTVDSPAANTLPGVLSGTGGLLKLGAGTLTLTNNSTYTGVTDIDAGRLNVNGSIVSDVNVNTGGTLGGTGTVGGTVDANSGGTVSPGTSPGILGTGDLIFDAGSTFDVEINGTTAGTQYDQLDVTGSVTINGGTPVFTGTANFGDQFMLIDNDGADLITGNFTGLPEGATIPNFLGSGITAGVTYTGGDGNDLVIGVGIYITDRTLYVLGTDLDDTVSIFQTGDGSVTYVQYRMGNVASGLIPFDPASFDDIFIEGRLGFDRLTVYPQISKPAEIHGGGDDDTINGGNGDDLITGGDGNDVINGYGGDNDIDAGEGNNRVNTEGNGTNTVVAGSGDDQIFTKGGDDDISAGEGNNYVQSGDGNDTVTAGAGNDNINTGNGNDDITAGDGANQIYSGAGDDTVTSGSGADRIIDTSGGNDVIDAGDGDNLIYVFGGDNSVTAGTGNDTVYAGTGNDRVEVGDGDNYVLAQGGANTVVAGSGDDRITGGTGSDLILAGGGNDTVNAAGGNDVVVGGDGDDVIEGSSGNDVLIGGIGADVVRGGTGEDIVIGGSTSSDGNEGNLLAILAQWTQPIAYADRVTALRGGLLGGGNVTDDADADTLTGNGNLDWFFGDLTEFTDRLDPAEEVN